jgi:hypothetical protein
MDTVVLENEEEQEFDEDQCITVNIVWQYTLETKYQHSDKYFKAKYSIKQYYHFNKQHKQNHTIATKERSIAQIFIRSS